MTLISARDGARPVTTELEDRIRQAVMRTMPTPIWGEVLSISATDDGTVTLGGHVRTRSLRELVLRAAARTRGVSSVSDNLIVDTDLEVAVAQALAANPLTASSIPGLLVGSAFGEIFLKGNVASAEIKRAASEVSILVPGVRLVHDQLVAPEPPKPAAHAKPAPVRPAARPAPKPAEEADSPAPEEE